MFSVKKPRHIFKRLSKEQKALFCSKIIKSSTCWFWSGVHYNNGYSYFRFNGQYIAAHRISYQEFVGKLHKDLVLDHLCRVRGCVNPKHLRQVPELVNVLCGMGASALNKRKTHCKRGHPLSGENLGTQWKGKNRKCIACAKKYHKILYQESRKDPLFIQKRKDYEKSYKSNPVIWKRYLAWQRDYRRKIKLKKLMEPTNV